MNKASVGWTKGHAAREYLCALRKKKEKTKKIKRPIARTCKRCVLCAQAEASSKSLLVLTLWCGSDVRTAVIPQCTCIHQ